MPKSVKQIFESTKTVIGTVKQSNNNNIINTIGTNSTALVEPQSELLNETLVEEIKLSNKNPKVIVKTKKFQFRNPFKKESIKSIELDENLVGIDLKVNEILPIQTSNSSNSIVKLNSSEGSHDLSVDVKIEKIVIKDKWYQQYVKPEYFLALVISLISAVLFFYSGISDKMLQKGVPDIKLEKVILFTFSALVIFDLIFVFLLGKNILQKLHIFVALITLQISAFLYSLKIYGSEIIRINDLSITTQVVLVILPIIIFLQIIDIIQKKNRMWVNIAQVFVILNQLFSTVKVFNDKSFTKQQFSSPILNGLFDLPPFVWVGFATIALAILSTYNLKQGYTRFIFVIGMMFPILNLLLFTKVTTPWYQTILGLIVWDMIYTPMYEAESEVNDDRVVSRLMVSSVYHIALYSAFLLFNTILNFITNR